MKRILIIEDAATVRLYYRGILEPVGYQVDEAVNGVEALEKVLLRPYDLYLVDISMPKLDGYGFLRELRQLAVPQVPAIMISTLARAEDRRRAFEAGANYYLLKPTRPEQLAAPVVLLLNLASPT